MLPMTGTGGRRDPPLQEQRISGWSSTFREKCRPDLQPGPLLKRALLSPDFLWRLRFEIIPGIPDGGHGGPPHGAQRSP